MRRVLTIACVSLAALGASPSQAALEPCKSLQRVVTNDGVYLIGHKIEKTRDKLLRITETYIPEMASFISDTNLRNHYKHTMFLIEEQESEWTLAETPEGQRYNAGPPVYRFNYIFTVTRPDKDALPQWAKRVEDTSLKRCNYIKDGLQEIDVSGASFGLKCTLTVNERTRPKLSGTQFIEVRGSNFQGTEILRAQYTIHYPQSVKDKTAAWGQILNGKFVQGQCTPLDK